MMTVDRRAGMPLRLQLAAVLREQIRSGRLRPGALTPSGPALAAEHAVSRYTADRALDLLASEGLVQRVPGVGTVVTAAGDGPVTVTAGPGARITARLPTPAERAATPGGIPAGVAVLVITQPGHDMRVVPADRAAVVVSCPR